MFKFIVPLLFVLFADGKSAGGKAEEAADKAPDKASEKAGDKAPDKSDKAEKSESDDKVAEKPADKAGDKASEKPGDKSGKAAAAKPAGKDVKAAAALAREGDRGDRDPLTHDVGKSPGRVADVATASHREGGKKPAAKGDRAGEGERAMTPPPGISANALRDEVGVRAGQQKAATDRERLEALSTDLARTRTALHEETTRLEGLMEKAKQAGVTTPPAAPAGGHAPGAASAPGAPRPAEAPRGDLNMPLGDPLAPSAYYRPAPPPPNFAVQVEVVSKAMKSMKPEQAAGILGHLERGLAAEVLQRMRPADAGAILGFLKPEVGAALAAEIVSRPPVVGTGKNKSDKEKP